MGLYNSIDRRKVLQSAGVIGAAAMVSPVAGAKPLIKLDPKSKADCALIFRKLAYSTDEKVGFWWLRGTRYALVDAALTPLWDMHIGIMFTAHDLPDGSFEVKSMSLNFYTDLETGLFMKQFKNPFNNKIIDIGYYAPKPAKHVYSVNGLEDKPEGALRDLISTGAIGPARIEGDQIWVEGDHLLRTQPDVDPAHRIRVNDMTTYIGLVRDVADPSIKMAPASQTFSDINTWPPWLQMGDQPGSYYSRVYGHKVFSYDAMPALWRSLVAQEFPDVAKDPIRALMG